MKKLIASLLVLASTIAFGATTVPVQLLNPTGSTSGQAILSTGASSAPAWGNVSISTLSGVLPIANGGTGQTTAAAAAHAFGLGTTDTPTFFGVTLNGSTAHSVVLGEGNGNPVSYTAVGTTGQILLGVTGADPAFGNNPTITGGSINSAPIGATTASTGKFTTIQATSTITPSTTAGIVGTTAADNAQAGSDGEFQAASNSGTSITTGTTVNATSIGLPAGDWNCWGQALFLPAATTVVSNIASGITTTSATLPASPDATYLGVTLSTGTNGTTALNPMIKRINISSTTTVYLVAEAGSVTTSTATVNGYLQCRRVR